MAETDDTEVFLIGLHARSFEEIAGEVGGSAYIGDVIRRGMENARAVVALFTPDEFSSLRPELRQEEDGEGRWQARPNVLFEAGMAMERDPVRTILVTLGPVELFSDIGGRHVVRLDNSWERRRALIGKLRGAGCKVQEESSDWMNPDLGGDFAAAASGKVRPLDPFASGYDEIEALRKKCARRKIGNKTLLDILSGIATAKKDWTGVGSDVLMGKVVGVVRNDDDVDNAYWWLLVYGVLRFRDINLWWTDEYWKNSVKYARVAHRGAELLRSLRDKPADEEESPDA